jgi:hypothetical protein
MNTIEMTDVDGDAMTITSRGSDSWITCTSGPDEVTVGPFPTHLVRRLFLRDRDVDGDSVATLLGGAATPAPATIPLTPDARERAWHAFVRLSETSSLREALDGALEAAHPESVRPAGAEELAQQLREIAITLDDVDALADQLVSLGYRKAANRGTGG